MLVCNYFEVQYVSEQRLSKFLYETWWNETDTKTDSAQRWGC